MRTTIIALLALGLTACRTDNVEEVIGELEGCWNIHTHEYTHTWSYTEGYESYAWVRGVRIYLHDDLLASADPEALACPDLEATEEAQGEDTWRTDCAGGMEYPDLFGGSRIELVQGDTSGDALYPDYMLWTFGIDDKYDAPFIAGPNDVYPPDGSIDTEDSDQKVSFQIAWQALADPGSDVGTTSADFLVDYWTFDQVCAADADEDPNDAQEHADCWSETDEPQSPGEVGEHWSPESDIVNRAIDACG